MSLNTRPGRGLAAVVAFAALAAPAVGQPQYSTTEVTVFSGLTFAEVDASGNPVANPNGVLEPGERAMLRLSAWFTPGVNTVVGYMENGVPRSGTLRALIEGIYDVVGSGGTAGQWEAGPVDPVWDLTGHLYGTPSPDSTGLRDIVFGQFPFNSQPWNTANPIIDVWRCIWTPESYEPRQVTFMTAAATDSGGPATWVGLYRGSPYSRIYASSLAAYGGVGFAVVPGPGTLVVLGAAVVFARRRR
jgi:hypothetical protein